MRLSRRNLLQGVGAVAAAGAGSGLFSAAAAPQQSGQQYEGDHDVPQRNKPLPWKERHFPYEKRKIAKAKVWPNGARMAFASHLALEMWDWDSTRIVAMAGLQPRRNAILKKTPLDTRTQVKYGAEVGLPRIRDILKDLDIKVTLLVCGSYAEDYPDIVREMASLGHEVNAHTYSYSTPTVSLTREQQREDMQKTLRICQQVTGHKPVGWLSQGAACNENTVELLAEEGFLYQADLQDDELPYFIDVNGKTLVEVPFRIIGNIVDYEVFSIVQRPMQEALAFLKQAFDAQYLGAANTPVLMLFPTHPYVLGRIDAAGVYAEFLRYIKSHPDVWIATYGDIAAWWKKQFNEGYPV